MSNAKKDLVRCKMKMDATYYGDKMAHVSGNGRIDFFISRGFDNGRNILRFWEQRICALSRDPWVFLQR